jgi:ribonuclease III
MDSLEARIGYQFKKRSLLTLALTHPSASHEQKSSGKDYQRLEFLGDAVVDHVIAETLFHMFPEEDEGFLSKLWSRAGRESTMAKIARELDLGAEIVLGRSEQKRGQDRDSTLADTLEAMIGAVHLDGGYAASQKLIQRLWKGELASLRLSPVDMNPKGQLQEMLQVPPWGETPTYRVTSSEGPDHLKSYEAVVVWKGRELASGSGRSKQDAQISAARQALLLPSLPLIIETERQKQPPK